MPATDLHEFKLAFATQSPESSAKVREEVNGALEDSKKNDRLIRSGYGIGDFSGHLLSSAGDFSFGDQDLKTHTVNLPGNKWVQTWYY